MHLLHRAQDKAVHKIPMTKPRLFFSYLINFYYIYSSK